MASPFDALMSQEFGFTPVEGGAPTAPTQAPFQPYRFDTGNAGVFGNALNFLFGPTQFAVNQKRTQNQQEAAARAARIISEDVQRGTPVAQAFVNLMSSPEGVQLFTSSDPNTFRGTMQDIVTTLSPKSQTLGPGQAQVQTDPRTNQPRVTMQMPDWQPVDTVDPVMGTTRREWFNRATGQRSATPPSPGAQAPAPPPVPGAPASAAHVLQAIGMIEAKDHTTVGVESKDPALVRQFPNPALRRPYGQYGIMGFNVGPWTREALGREMTIPQFLQDAEAQKKVALHKLTTYYQQYGNWNDVAVKWFTGRSISEGGLNAGPDALGTRAPAYLQMFQQNLAQLTGQPPAPPAVPGAPRPFAVPGGQVPGLQGTQGQPPSRMTRQPGAFSQGQTPPVTPAENMTSWQSIQNAYGITPGLIDFFAGFAGQVIPEMQRVPVVKEIQRNRNRLALDVEDAIRVYVNSLPGMQDSTRAQAEMDRIRKAMNLDPRFWKSEQDGYNSLLSLDERLRFHLERAERNAQAYGKLPVKDIQTALGQASALRDAIARLGVPPPGDPARENPPTTGAWDLLKRLGGEEEAPLKRGVKKMEQGEAADPQKAFDSIMTEVEGGKVPDQNDPRVQALVRAGRADLLRKLGERNQELIRKRGGR